MNYQSTSSSYNVYRQLGRTGIEVSSVGIGTWAMGAEWGTQEDQESIATLHRALDLGCRLIDTAQVYGDGRSEQLIGRVLKERGEHVPVATKVPPMDGNWETIPDVTDIREKFPAHYLIERCEVSLRNLQMDCVDVYQLHTWCPSWNNETEWYEAMLKLKEQGKIKAIGISVSDNRPDEANDTIAAGRVDSIQVIYNLLEQRPRFHLFPLARTHNVGILARVPLASGALSGTWTEHKTFAPDDWRANVFTGETLRRTVSHVNALKQIAAEVGCSMLEFAVRYCISDPAVSSTIPGARTPEQAEALMRAMQASPLPEGALRRIEELWEQEFKHQIRTSIGPGSEE
jgi:aryl-alcohol dehydrogenase-like predicted oxidoreductase